MVIITGSRKREREISRNSSCTRESQYAVTKKYTSIFWRKPILRQGRLAVGATLRRQPSWPQSGPCPQNPRMSPPYLGSSASPASQHPGLPGLFGGGGLAQAELASHAVSHAYPRASVITPAMRSAHCSLERQGGTGPVRGRRSALASTTTCQAWEACKSQRFNRAPARATGVAGRAASTQHVTKRKTGRARGNLSHAATAPA